MKTKKTDANDVARAKGSAGLRAELDKRTAEAPVHRNGNANGNGQNAPHNLDSTAMLRKLADVHAQPLQWLWPRRFPLGKFTMLSGDPGLGKSFVTLDIAARLSTGNSFPDQKGKFEVGSSIFLNAEDDAEDTIRPRLDAMGADVNRVYVLDAVRVGGQEKHFNLATDLAALEEAIQKTPNVRLVVIDPISAYLGKTDSHKNSEVRGILSPLSKLIARLGVAVIGISHNTKGKETKAVYRSIGSIAFTAAARAVWSVMKDHDDPLRRLMLPVKMNLCAESTGLAFRLQKVTDEMAVVQWDTEPITINADDALAAEIGERGELKSDMASEWLRELLAAGPLPVDEVKRSAEAAGYAWATVRRAMNTAGVQSRREGGIGAAGRWVWTLK